MSQAAIDDAMITAHCLGCDYSLRGLIDPRCPECGRPFDPADPDSFRTPGFLPRLRRRLKLPSASVGVWIGIALLLVCLWRGVVDPAGDWEPGIPLAGIVALATWGRSRVRRWILNGTKEPGPHTERWARRALYMFCVASALLGAGPVQWSCPHGTAIGIGIAGVAISPNGGPCHNAHPTLHSWHVAGNLYVWVAPRIHRC